MREIEIEINQEIEINTDGFGLKSFSGKNILLFLIIQIITIQTSCHAWGGGGRVKVGQNILAAFECYIYIITI